MFSVFGAVDYENRVEFCFSPSDTPKKIYITDHAFFVLNKPENKIFDSETLNFYNHLYTVIYSYNNKGFFCVYEEERQKLFLFQDVCRRVELLYTYSDTTFMFSDRCKPLEEYIKKADTEFAPIKQMQSDSRAEFSREGLKIYN